MLNSPLFDRSVNNPETHVAGQRAAGSRDHYRARGRDSCFNLVAQEPMPHLVAVIILANNSAAGIDANGRGALIELLGHPSPRGLEDSDASGTAPYEPHLQPRDLLLDPNNLTRIV